MPRRAFNRVFQGPFQKKALRQFLHTTLKRNNDFLLMERDGFKMHSFHSS